MSGFSRTRQTAILNFVQYCMYCFVIYFVAVFLYCTALLCNAVPVRILYHSIAGRYRPVSYPDGPITTRYRFIKNARWVVWQCITLCKVEHLGELYGHKALTLHRADLGLSSVASIS